MLPLTSDPAHLKIVIREGNGNCRIHWDSTQIGSELHTYLLIMVTKLQHYQEVLPISINT